MRNRAFTLIELLIVVAIIAILAAIAVPNFLEAQTRSKVSRFLADIRTAATGLESYRIDSNIYPPPDHAAPGSDLSITGPFWPIQNDPPENYLTHRLTTPIAYLSSLPVDVFPSREEKSPGIPITHAPHYINDEFSSRWAAAPWASDNSMRFFSARTRAGLKTQSDPGNDTSLYDYVARWHLHSHGPDRDHDDFSSDQGYPTAYDPTNGTVSDGDIFYFGPSIGSGR
jgi:prepilin-type N-terminal cleavage/methylation domain-containing protein